jgi:hypothetical protein
MATRVSTVNVLRSQAVAALATARANFYDNIHSTEWRELAGTYERAAQDLSRLTRNERTRRGRRSSIEVF